MPKKFIFASVLVCLGIAVVAVLTFHRPAQKPLSPAIEAPQKTLDVPPAPPAKPDTVVPAAPPAQIAEKTPAKPAIIESKTEVASAQPPITEPKKEVIAETKPAVLESKSTDAAPLQPQIKQTSAPLVKIETAPAQAPAKLTLEQIAAGARSWEPAFLSWKDQSAPDFTLTDIEGNQHTLSNYRGKNVLIIFWATWCGPCRSELPTLIALRNTNSPDKLVMLAISRERPDIVQKFASMAKINYTLLIEKGSLPAPYNAVNGIPSSFFINPDGKIKLATSGTMSFGEIKAILAAD